MAFLAIIALFHVFYGAVQCIASPTNLLRQVLVAMRVGSYGFPKNEKGNKLCEEFNSYLFEKTLDGTLKEMEDKWFVATKA